MKNKKFKFLPIKTENSLINKNYFYIENKNNVIPDKLILLDIIFRMRKKYINN